MLVVILFLCMSKDYHRTEKMSTEIYRNYITTVIFLLKMAFFRLKKAFWMGERRKNAHLYSEFRSFGEKCLRKLILFLLKRRSLIE